MNLWAKLSRTWQLAIKQAVSAACAIFLTNVVDPAANYLFTWPWWKHMLVAMLIFTAINEARYWKTWADGPGATT